MITNQNLARKLDHWVRYNKNVLFVGSHGVGKTALVKETFDRYGLNWRYFSASTMDPWVDFVGVPREKIDDKIPSDFAIIKELARISDTTAVEWIQSNWKMSQESAVRILSHAISRQEGVPYLDLVRPQTFATGQIEALFFDEFNRSPKKVRNAVMELLQFKSINGMRFENLRFVWAAINPEDDEDANYDVEPMDPAQKDRFHITTLMPFKPSKEYFEKTYGPKIAEGAIQYWNDLPEDIKKQVSPRRLQYAVDMFIERGDMRDVLPKEANQGKLKNYLNFGPITDRLEELMKSKSKPDAKTFLANENNYSDAINFIKNSETFSEFFLPLLPPEKLGVLMSENDRAATYIITNSEKVPEFNSVCEEIVKANANAVLVKRIRRHKTNTQEEQQESTPK